MSTTYRSKSPKTKPKYIFSILSMALTLFILGGFALFLVASQTVIRYFKENVEIITELTPTVTDSTIKNIETLLNQQPFLKPNSLEFISKEDGAAMLQDELEEDFIALEIGNPLADIFTFKVTEVYMTPDSLSLISDQLMEIDGVGEVFYEVGAVEGIYDNINRLGFIALILIFIFLLVTVAAINGTVKLAMYSDRFLIKNMQLVGAEWAYIRKPYLQRSTWNGILSGVIAALGLGGLLYWAISEIPDLWYSLNLYIVSSILLSLVILGGGIAYFAAYQDINQYLKMKLEELY